MSCVGEFGVTAVAAREMVINQQLHAFHCPAHLDEYFLAHALRLQKGFMERIAHFTRLPYMSKDKCNSIPIPLPPLPEQREIAAQLAAVDAKLAAEESRRAALAALFQSLLHYLMTGKVRLPEFVQA